ncbi:MAG: hypothetical protein Q4P06_05230 [Actinomycetaceae bacterium]|nr:hypothetical protein [Actinomycetaceae bacterium]
MFTNDADFEKYQFDDFKKCYSHQARGTRVEYIDPDATGSVAKTVYFARITQFLNKRVSEGRWGDRLNNLIFLPPTDRLPAPILGCALGCLIENLGSEQGVSPGCNSLDDEIKRLKRQRKNGYEPPELELAESLLIKPINKDDVRQKILQLLGLQCHKEPNIISVLWRCYQVREKRREEIEKAKCGNLASKIATLDITNPDEPELVFFLASDQLGFSAEPTTVFPKHKADKYPLGIAWLLAQDIGADEENRILARLTDYVHCTRTLGGAFLWPTDDLTNGKCQYNVSRGVRSSIEDRVDLTLLEIKHYLDDRNNYDSKFGQKECLGTKAGNVIREKWLCRFGTFQEYVDFMIFGAFVDEENSELMPFSIFGKFPVEYPDRKQIQQMYKEYDATQYEPAEEKEQAEQLLQSIEGTLARVESRVMKRTRAMEDYLGIRNSAVVV